ncbi:glucosamine-6-phosphate deaminase (plasmid) [Alteromonas macleodii]|jgi:glucosamine-6-phosphate deaminase|tara:strand:+ start:1378 stop:2184 length:807 start_codon:yes stop_codon:yes gene_type:complete
MQIIIHESPEKLAQSAAQWVQALLIKKTKPVLGLATGSTPIKLYKVLVEKHQRGELSFADVKTFNLDEYFDIDAKNPQSYRSFMKQHLFDHVDINPSNTFLPTCKKGQDPREQGLAYEKEIKEAGGIDLQILGIGGNGHIGFNEPSSSLRSRTRIKTLTQQTLKDNSRLFTPGEYQPTLAMTMGIATILDAKYVMLMATGKQKATAVKQMITGGVSANCPASVLQMHENAVIFLDKEAASELDDHEYYEWANEQNNKLNESLGFFHNF